jgi:hypothetical protein
MKKFSGGVTMRIYRLLGFFSCFLLVVYFGLFLNAHAIDNDGDGIDSIATGGGDCDDNDSNRYPGNIETCDGDNHDEDCDPFTFGVRDSDGDGFIDHRCCNFDASSSALICGKDCNDFLRFINPLQNDICNGIDDDCDGIIDDDGHYRSVLYPDSDQDGYGVPAGTPSGFVTGCSVPMGNLGIGDVVGGLEYSFNSSDCDDSNPAIKPGAMICSPESPDIVLVCNSEGQFEMSLCNEDSQCVSQPNGTGFCQAKKFKKKDK